jgi:hypothetical protein
MVPVRDNANRTLPLVLAGSKSSANRGYDDLGIITPTEAPIQHSTEKR